MADDLHYVPGDFYRLDDRSGFKVRAKRMRMEWTQLIVDRNLFELRPAQDFVKGVIDDQTVPLPRPRPAQDSFVGPLQTSLFSPPLFLENNTPLLLETGRPLQLEGAGVAGSLTIGVVSTVGMQIGDVIQIMLDNDTLFTTTIASIPVSGTITLSHTLPSRASTGNIVLDLTQSKNILPDNEDFLT